MTDKRIRDTILAKGGDILNVYFTAGYPALDSTADIIKALADSGVDLIELGMPYSDPLADGTTIQQSSEQALKNGLTLSILFDQIREARSHTAVPIIMMGYYNQLLQFGEERFLRLAADCSVDGMIIPDLPMDIYEKDYRDLFEKYGIAMSFLVTPMTSDERIRQADRLSSAFIYVVSSSSITGKSGDISGAQVAYFQRIKSMKLDSPQLIGFGIHDRDTYETACKYSHGAIIGSAYIRALKDSKDVQGTTTHFIEGIRS